MTTAIEIDLATEIEGLLADLRMLGTPAAIADFFEKAGYGGEQCSSEACILANYFRAEACCDYVSVNDNEIECTRGGEHYRGPIPWIVSDFVRAYDNGEFPQLSLNHKWVGEYGEPPY